MVIGKLRKMSKCQNWNDYCIGNAPIHERNVVNDTASSGKLILWFKDLSIADVPLVGGKNASLGEMVRELGSNGIRVPNGFAITASAYRQFLSDAGLVDKIRELLSGWRAGDVTSLAERGTAIRRIILEAHLPKNLVNAISDAYIKLSREAGVETLDVAVRSSATAEDLPDASFAGQQETFLNINGQAMLLESVKKCFASLYTDRAISYRVHKGFAEADIALSVGVQRMVRSDLATSGVMFSLDTETGFRDVVLINAAYGLGETVVQGSVNPDEYYVFKPTLGQGHRPIIRKKRGQKAIKLVYDLGGNRQTLIVPVSDEEQRRFALSDDEILQLAQWAVVIEEHYSQKRDCPTPMDIEWAKDGVTGEMHIVQARPETVQARKNYDTLEIYKLVRKGKILTEGAAIGEKIASGKVRVINELSDLHKLKAGEILVTDKTDPDWEPSMKTAIGIITNRGGRTCHAAIVSRELGLAAIVGTHNATAILKDGQEITLSCAEGDVGKVYEGNLPFEIEKVSVEELKVSNTDVMLNVANPEEALRLSFLPNDGVGLARVEFIINNYIRIHPLALLDYPKLGDVKAMRAIEELTYGYEDKTRYFVDKLAEGVAMIGAAFYPKPVIVRFSDFKTNEYAHLIGGEAYEPKEANPMIGFRGASRYYSDAYRRGFALECQALLKVRGEMGLTNVKVMVPFCRTVEEGRKVLAEMASNGLERGKDGLEVYMMCEIPSNVVLADQFAELFDGFSIGSNDLTQLVLGIDRDSEILSSIFDERNEAVTRMITQVIETAHMKGVKIGICGQAPSDYPEFAEFLISRGIDSISLAPDVVVRTRRMIAELEGAARDH